jgi:hypothetical protein
MYADPFFKKNFLIFRCFPFPYNSLYNFFIFHLILSVLLSCSSLENSESDTEYLLGWNDGVAEIMEKRCVECHNPSGPAPFSLCRYEDSKAKANLIRFALENNLMPPWPADTTYTRFLYEKIISEKEKKIILNWIKAGCPVGIKSQEVNKAIVLSPPEQQKPDLIVKMPSPVQLPGKGRDFFAVVKFPYSLPADTWLDYVRFVPHQKKWVHHVNGHLIHFTEKNTPDYFQGVPWYAEVKDSLRKIYENMNLCYREKNRLRFPLLTTNVVYYLPGYFPLRYPDNIGGWKLSSKGVFLMNNLHYGPTPHPITDSSYLEVFFRKTKPQRPIRELQLGTLGISDIVPPLVVPPNEVKTFTTQAIVQQKISLLSVNPHMHLIGKSYWAFAIRPNGDTIPLIRIKRWDFRWQYYYTFPRPVVLEAGTRLVVIATYDNRDSNPNNPKHPPDTVSEGKGNEAMRTTDEMFQFIFTYVPYREGDEKISLFRN